MSDARVLFVYGVALVGLVAALALVAVSLEHFAPRPAASDCRGRP